MVNTEVQDLAANTDPQDTDVTYLVDDPAGTAASKKIALSVLKTYTSASPTLVTPALGTPSSGVISACTSTSMVMVTPVLGTPTSGNISNCTSTNMVLVTPALGTPSALVLTNATGLPLAGILAAAKTEFISVAAGDETTVLAAASTSVPLVTFHAPYAMTLTNIKAGLTAAGTGAALVTVDVHVAGTTVMSTTKVTIDASEKTSGTAATAPVLTTTSVAADAIIEIFVDQRDTNNVAAGLKVYLIGYQT